MSVVAQRTVNLVANTPLDIVYGGVDFQNHFGNAVIDKSVSIAFTIFNPASQAVFCSIRYTTIYETLSIVEKRSFGGVPGTASGTTIYLSYKTAPELAALKPRVTSITLTLVSIVAVTGVIVSLEINDATTTASGGNTPLLTLDTSLANDFTYRNVAMSGASIPAATTSSVSVYVNDPLIRATLVSLTINCIKTPYQSADLRFWVTIGNMINPPFALITPFVIASMVEKPIEVTIFPNLEIIIGSSLIMNVQNNNPLRATTATVFEFWGVIMEKLR